MVQFFKTSADLVVAVAADDVYNDDYDYEKNDKITDLRITSIRPVHALDECIV